MMQNLNWLCTPDAIKGELFSWLNNGNCTEYTTHRVLWVCGLCWWKLLPLVHILTWVFMYHHYWSYILQKSQWPHCLSVIRLHLTSLHSTKQKPVTLGLQQCLVSGVCQSNIYMNTRRKYVPAEQCSVVTWSILFSLVVMNIYWCMYL